ncbi:MAG: NAD-dependent epimerase/dehydratase family protein [Candidatus Aminicenantes bacterium]|nr:NAD-dependent epimerase/dehydratase family protein [Candidatus Aminicenantes bacterium]
MKVLVTGATGAVGPRVVDELCSAGYQVRTFSLDTLSQGAFPSGVQSLIGDVTDLNSVQSAMEGISAVVNLAALLHIVNPPPELRKKYERINVGGTINVIDAAVKAGVKRVILASTIAIYGPSNGEILNEDSNTHPTTFYAETKLAAEKIVLNAKCADGLPLGTVLRFGAVYGARIKGNYQRLIKALARGRFITVGDGSNRRTLIYDKDLARAVKLAVSHHAAAGQVFNVTDGRFPTLKQLIAAMSLALGRIPPRYSLPLKPVRWTVGLLEDVARIMGCQSPIARAMIDKYVEDIAVSGEKISRFLGFSAQYDLASGWRETVEDMRQAGEL